LREYDKESIEDPNSLYTITCSSSLSSVWSTGGEDEERMRRGEGEERRGEERMRRWEERRGEERGFPENSLQNRWEKKNLILPKIIPLLINHHKHLLPPLIPGPPLPLHFLPIINIGDPPTLNFLGFDGEANTKGLHCAFEDVRFFWDDSRDFHLWVSRVRGTNNIFFFFTPSKTTNETCKISKNFNYMTLHTK
jgi:hypothetical protein